MLPKKRKFKEISPDKPVDRRIGNTFASKPEEEKQTQTLTVYMTKDDKKKCEAAAKRRKVKVGPWARQILVARAKETMLEPSDTTQFEHA